MARQFVMFSRGLERKLSLGLFALGAASAAYGQSTPEAQPAASAGTEATATQGSESGGAAPVEEVTVTATRVGRSGFTAPTPTTVIGADQIQQQGATNVAQVLDLLPSVKADTSAQTNGVRSITPGANYVDLRGLGATRTLVLVDGNRFVPQVTNGVDSDQVDLNQIPALLIERTEVVTGGASAQWGSDAIGGVVNIILKKNFEGVMTDFEGGESQAGDDRDVHLGLLAGHKLFDGRGHVEGAVDYERNDGVGDVFTRDWGRQGWQIVANPSPASNHLPTNLILPNVQFSTLTPGGLITNSLLKGTQFAPGGVPIPFQYGTLVGGTNMVGGGQPGININTGPSIEPWLRRLNLYGRASYELTDSVTAHLEASYSSTDGGGTSLPARDTTPIVITQDNAFLPTAVRDAMIANNITSFNLGRADYDSAQVQSDDTNRTRRIVLGFDGSIFSDYTWDAHYEYGKNQYTQRVANDRIHSNYLLAADAVVNPANGQIVCRSTLTNPNNGCQPLDLFGAGSPSAAATGYVTGTEWSATDYTQQSAAANLHGEPFHDWAGPVSIATGLEYRSERQFSNTDPISQAAGYETSNSEPLRGDYSVSEGYLETVVPLLHDAPLAKSLDFNGAVRVSHYSTAAGTQPTWKLGLTYAPVGGLLLRGSLSQDIRAPNLFELFSRGNVTNQLVTFGTVQSNPFVTTTGNPDLQPETARTTTAGISFQPDGSGLQTSLDYYDIDLTKAIAAITAQQVATFCLAGQSYFCSLMTLNNGVPATIQAAYLNLASVDINGFDMAAAYNLPLSRIYRKAPGELRASFTGNYVLHSWVDTGLGGARVDRAGEVGPNNAYSFPHFNMTSSLGYVLGGVSVTAQLRYIQAGNYDNTYTQGLQINNNHIPGVVYVNLYLADQISDHLEVYGAVNNLLNKNPPPDPATLGYPTNPTYYDMIGRDFRLGFRLKF